MGCGRRAARSRLAHARCESIEDVDTDQVDLAVALGITHDISDDVRRYVDAHLHSIGQAAQLAANDRAKRTGCSLGSACVRPGSSRQGCCSAGDIAHYATWNDAYLCRSAELAHFLLWVNNSRFLGRVRLYEFDFEGGRWGLLQRLSDAASGKTLGPEREEQVINHDYRSKRNGQDCKVWR